jgi:hypothetical protein
MRIYAQISFIKTQNMTRLKGLPKGTTIPAQAYRSWERSYVKRGVYVTRSTGCRHEDAQILPHSTSQEKRRYPYVTSTYLPTEDKVRGCQCKQEYRACSECRSLIFAHSHVPS